MAGTHRHKVVEIGEASVFPPTETTDNNQYDKEL
jgi:hypothetical protein